MKRTKCIKSLITLTAIGLMLILFSTSVFAAEKRPISAFTDTNDNIAAWASPMGTESPLDDLTLFPHGWYLFPFIIPEPQPQTIADCNPTGSVVVRPLKGGEILYKVDLHVKGALIYIADIYGAVLFEGEMDYHFQATVILYDGELSDPIPNLLWIWFPEFFLPGLPPIGEGSFSHLTGEGTGTFVDDAAALEFGFNLGDTANVKINQVGILKPEDHPTYDGEDFSHWPVEFIFFH